MLPNETLKYYDQNAESFAAGTVGVPFTEIQDRFLALLPPGGKILDFGCGSGRDTMYFHGKGFSVDVCIKTLWVTEDVRPNRGNEKWLNIILQKMNLR